MDRKNLLVIAISALCVIPAMAQEAPVEDSFKSASDSIVNYLREKTTVTAKPHIEKVAVVKGKLRVDFSESFTDFPLRSDDVAAVYSILNEMMPAEYAKYNGKVAVYGHGQPIEDLVSNFYSGNRNTAAVKEHKKFTDKGRSKVQAPLVKNLSRPYAVTDGLQDRHIAMWQSHGFYYEPKLQRWEWQRARILETVEDLYTQSYVVPFLVPMLEKAGAVVMLPRERDWQKNEVIVDNDAMNGYGESGSWSDAPQAGFADAKKFYTYKENPFEMGTARVSSAEKKNTKASARWIPEIPEAGQYGVYVSYQTVKNSTAHAKYTVKHKGGSTEFNVNQKMGGGTWIFLGYFDFEAGADANQGVFLSNETAEKGTVVTADAVKFGGGMGNMAQKPLETEYEMEPEISGYPRFTEGSRYWLQWAGFNDTIYSWTLGTNDYTDDYMSRGRWVNTLSDGSYMNPKKKGYNIPLDLSFAFHTDAGTTLNDDIVGTLSIYTRYSNNSDRYADGESRMAGRELADIVQTELTNDIRTLFEPQWSRRYLWDRSYSESRTPEVPAMLLEFLSHQNLADMKYGLDPVFRFHVSRAIYKGMLKFVAYMNNTTYTVQPLPVVTFAADIAQDETGSYASLSWQPARDPLEESATPTGYVLYTRIDGGSFDNGVAVADCSVRIPIEAGHIYSFRVSATNAGGESFQSETLSVGLSPVEDAKVAMIINNFTRICAPVSFASRDSMYAGFADKIDAGVPYGFDISYIGAQHEFRRHIPWMDDDSAGFGACDSDYETTVIAGNTFDYPYVHGKAMMAAGYSFTSASRTALEGGCLDLLSYPVVDVICGKQISTQVGRKGSSPVKYTVFTKEIQKLLTEYTEKGGNLIVSGSNIGSDIWEPIYDVPAADAKDFAQNILKFKWLSNSASAIGKVKSVQNPAGMPAGVPYSFRTRPNEQCYAVESPDAIVPADRNACTIFRYADNNIPAGVAYNGDDYKAIVLGFPIEVLETEGQIEEIMNDILNFFEK